MVQMCMGVMLKLIPLPIYWDSYRERRRDPGAEHLGGAEWMKEA